MAGLIHDVGKIILDSYIAEKKEEFESYMEKEEKTSLEAESHYFGFNHAEIASEVCKKWNFPRIHKFGHQVPSPTERLGRQPTVLYPSYGGLHRHIERYRI